MTKKVNHKITIKNLGPIELIKDFEIKDINILAGESASGKSIIAKTIFVFNDLLKKNIPYLDIAT